MISSETHVQCWDGCTDLWNIKRCIRCGHPVLILMRGVPGSGKSFLAKQLVQNTSGLILSTDDLFFENGVYSFDPSKLQENHRRNLNQAKAALLNGIKPIIIDNTNIYVAHMSPYVKQALRHHYEIYLVEPQTEWKCKPQICAVRSEHNVAKEKISYLLDSFERVSLATLIRPVTLKLIPPTDVDLEDDSCLLHKKEGRSIWRIDGVNSWSSLLPDVQDKDQELASSSQCSEHATAALDSKDGTQERSSTDTPSSSYMKTFDEVIEGEIGRKIEETGCAEKTEISNNFPLFSLLPEPEVFLISCQSVGVQTNDIIRTLIVREVVKTGDIQSAVIMKSEVNVVEKAKNGEKLNVKDRVSQTESSPLPTELDLLLSLFPYEAPEDLQHLLQTCGFENTVRINFEMHSKLDLFANAAEDMLPIASGLSGRSELVSNSFSNVICTSRANSYGDDTERGVFKLPPSSSKQRCSPDPVEDGYYRMELSLDMIQKLSELFDNGSESNIERAYVDLPVWFCRQMFEYWHKLPISSPSEGEGFKCNDFNLAFPSVGSSHSSQNNCEDDMSSIIKRIDLTSDKKNSRTTVRKKLTTAQKLQLNHLYEKFPSVDRDRIEECYYDTNFSLEAVENTVNLFLEQEELPDESVNKGELISVCNSNRIPDNVAKVKNFSEKNVKVTTSEGLRAEAEKIQDEIEYCNQQRNSLYSKAASSKYPAAKQFYVSDARQYDKRVKLLIAQKNALISKANDSKRFLDLHHMSVPAAIKLLKEKLNCLDRPPNLRNGRSDRKLTVITGYGKNTMGAVKVKPAVLQWLNQLHYDYYLPNPGEVIVTAK